MSSDEQTIIDEVLATLRTIANQKREVEHSDNPCEDSGGNFDDAYWMGVERGEQGGINIGADLAKSTLDSLQKRFPQLISVD